MEHVDFACGACGLRIEADEAPDRAEGETYVRVFWCGRERSTHLLDAEAPSFRGRCPECSEPLVALHFPLQACPSCLAPTHARRAFTGPL